MAQVFHWPPVRRHILGRYAEAKPIGPQPQNTWGNTSLGIPQIQFRNKTNTYPTLAIAEVWIMGMDHGYVSYPLKWYGSWVLIIGYGSHVGPGPCSIPCILTCPHMYIYILLHICVHVYRFPVDSPFIRFWDRTCSSRVPFFGLPCRESNENRWMDNLQLIHAKRRGSVIQYMDVTFYHYGDKSYGNEPIEVHSNCCNMYPRHQFLSC